MSEGSAPAVGALLDFRGRVVVVTGASGGIGAGLARRFAEAGAAVAISYRSDEAGARAVVAAIEAAGGRALAEPADVGRREDVERLVERAASLGGLHVVVNNAGSYPVSPLLEMSDAEWDGLVAAHLRGAHLVTQIAARRMKATGGGAVVNVTSIEAHAPAAGHAHYAAAKAGLLQYTKTAALELGPCGIRVNAVSPGLIDSGGLEQAWPDGARRWLARVPLARLGTPLDVADACLFLASPAARWITGAEIVVDGGILAAPAF